MEVSKHGAASKWQEQSKHARNVHALNVLVQAVAFSSADVSRLTALLQQLAFFYWLSLGGVIFGVGVAVVGWLVGWLAACC